MQIHGSKTLRSRQPVPVLSIFRGLLEGRCASLARTAWRSACGCCRATRREILTACRRAEIAPATWNDLRRTGAMAATSWRVGGTDR